MKCLFNAKPSKFHAVAISIAHSTTQSSFQIFYGLCISNAFKTPFPFQFEYKLDMEGEKFKENLILIPTITSSFSQHTRKPPFPSTFLFFTTSCKEQERVCTNHMLPQIPHPVKSALGDSAREESPGSALPLPSEPHLQPK